MRREPRGMHRSNLCTNLPQRGVRTAKKRHLKKDEKETILETAKNVIRVLKQNKKKNQRVSLKKRTKQP